MRRVCITIYAYLFMRNAFLVLNVSGVNFFFSFYYLLLSIVNFRRPRLLPCLPKWADIEEIAVIVRSEGPQLRDRILSFQLLTHCFVLRSHTWHQPHLTYILLCCCRTEMQCIVYEQTRGALSRLAQIYHCKFSSCSSQL